ncbi:MAG: glycosyltransferase, partial [Promethearchaeota archaeon]
MSCSESTKFEINKYMGVPKKKIVNVSSAIDPIYKPMPKPGKLLKERLKLNGPVILYIGRIAFYKGIEDIIHAYKIAKKQISDLKLVIGGKPTLKMKENVKKWMEDNPGVLFTGMIPDEEMPIFYSMADLFITYSFASEGFGLTPIEALACGTPVICSKLPAYEEVLKDSAFFLKPKSPILLSKKIVHLIKHP